MPKLVRFHGSYEVVSLPDIYGYGNCPLLEDLYINNNTDRDSDSLGVDCSNYPSLKRFTISFSHWHGALNSGSIILTKYIRES